MKYKMGLIIFLTIAFMGCASTVPETKYMPQESDSVFPFFSSGQPIAAVQTSNGFMLLSLDRDMIANQPYFQLWILYQNISDEPYLLEPLNIASLNVTSIKKNTMGTSTPESPTKILAHISNEKAMAMVLQAIGGTLQSMATKPTAANTRFNDGSSATTTFNDRQEKQNTVADGTANAMANTAMWYDIYQNSVGDGILRKNTVFPGQGVNGYIYFPFPRILKIQKGYYEKNPSLKDFANEKFFFTLNLSLYGENLEIYFTPIAGE